MGKTNRNFNENGSKGNRAIRDKQRKKMKQTNKVDLKDIIDYQEELEAEQWAESFLRRF